MTKSDKQDTAAGICWVLGSAFGVAAVWAFRGFGWCCITGMLVSLLWSALFFATARRLEREEQAQK